MRYIFLSLFLVCVSLCPALAGDPLKDDPRFMLVNLKQQKYSIDTSAPAIVLYENISYDLAGNGIMPFKKVKVHRIIKILNKSGLQYADVDIPVHNTRQHTARIKKVSGTTYNLTEDGNSVDEQDLDKSSVSSDQFLHRKEKKFSMPAVHVGSIISYTYEIEQDIFLDFGVWHVQEEMPKLFSELDIVYPPEFEIISLRQHMPDFEMVDKNGFDTATSNAYTYFTKTDMFEKKWVRKNIVGVDEEPIISNLENYMEKMQFVIRGYFTAHSSHLYDESWDKVNKELLEHKNFYKKIDEDSHEIATKARILTAKDTSDLERAKTIFAFVRNSIALSGNTDIYADKDPETVLSEKAGSSTEKNMLLISMLRAARLKCSPVILSTTANGLATEVYSDISRFDYTVCELRIKDKKYYLDAAHKYNAFGILPEDCYNGYARVVDELGSGIWLETGMVREKSSCNVTTSDTSLANYTLDFKFTYGEFSAHNHRAKWNDDTTEIKKYITTMLKSYGIPTVLKSYSISNLNEPDKPLTLTFKAGIEWPAEDAVIYLCPYFYNYFNENPFKSNLRKYPVEMPYAYNISYNCKLQLPAIYKADELPSPLRNNFDDNVQTQYITMYDPSSNTLNVNAQTIILKTVFPVEEYPKLKDFFDKMLEQQKKIVILKSTRHD